MSGAPKALMPELGKYRCNFTAEAGERCEDCRSEILEGAAMFFFSYGGYEPRDGIYRCYSCTIRLLTGAERETSR